MASTVMALAGLLPTEATARADAGGTTDPRVAEAVQRCAAGDARVGVSLLKRVHVDTLEPRYVLDQAQCLENNGLPREAAERLKFYLSLKGTVSGSDRLGAQLWLDRLRARLAATAAPAGEPPEAPAQPAPVQRASVPRQGDAQTVTERRPSSSRRRMASLLLAGTAGGVLAGAITLQTAREGRAADYNRRCYPLHGTSCDQMLGRVQAAQVGAVIGYVTAALLAGGATYLHATAPERSASEVHTFRCRRGERSRELVCGTTY